MRFDPEYVSHVLVQNFEDSRALFLDYLVDLHYAHLVMLAERGIVSAADAHALREALDALSVPDLRALQFDGSSEDLYYQVERALVDRCGQDVAGRLHTARSRNDIDMTLYRMRQREALLSLAAAANDLRAVLLHLAGRHRETILAAQTHTQPAQPTTLAHYLLAVAEQLGRDVGRVRAAFASTNRCPLGACAITGTGFAIDRRLTSRLLGFAGPTGNTYGSIATVDYVLEGVSAAGVLTAGLGRVVQDLLLWCTMEFGYLRLSDGFVQSSSIMPQKRNPVALEHARAIGSRALGQMMAVMVGVHNTPFGDIVDTEDDLQPLVAATFRDATRAVALVAAALRTAAFDVGRMASRAAEGGTTLTELADRLVRSQGMSFGKAHEVAAGVARATRDQPDRPVAALLREVAAAALGTPLEWDDQAIASALDPREFVEVRRTAGGPAPAETGAAVEAGLVGLAADAAWLDAEREQLRSASAWLRERSGQL